VLIPVARRAGLDRRQGQGQGGGLIVGDQIAGQGGHVEKTTLFLEIDLRDLEVAFQGAAIGNRPIALGMDIGAQGLGHRLGDLSGRA